MSQDRSLKASSSSSPTLFLQLEAQSSITYEPAPLMTWVRCLKLLSITAGAAALIHVAICSGRVGVGDTHQPSRALFEAPWDGENMVMTHYWDCNGQGCDAATLEEWDPDEFVSPPGYGPQDPNDFGGPVYGEKLWLTGAASDALSALMGEDDGCCGADANDGGVGGCGKCLLVQNPDSSHPDWTAIVMKKSRCPLDSPGCAADEPHFDVAAPGFDHPSSTANVCGVRAGTGFESKLQSQTLGSWWDDCSTTADCSHLCAKVPAEFQAGCLLFASWGWSRGNPSSVKFKAVTCPSAFVNHIASQFDKDGVVVPTPAPTPAPMPPPTPAPTPAPSCTYAAKKNTAVKNKGTGGAKLKRKKYSSTSAYLAACEAACNADSTCGGFVDDPTDSRGRRCKPKKASSGYKKKGKTFYIKGASC